MKSLIPLLLRNVSPVSPWDNRELIREELFSIERLEQHAKTLAAAQKVTTKQITGRSLASRLNDNSSVLLEAYRSIAIAVGEDRSITPAAEWLLDNYHIVEEQIREIHDDLPPGYYRQLPKLADGHLAGYPRVLGIAWAFVAHTDSRFDPDMLSRFVHAYQQVQPLTIGELWAVAITLRILLVENLRRATERIVIGKTARQEGDTLADLLLNADGPQIKSIDTFFQRYEQVLLPRELVVQLVHRLRDQGPKVTPALIWLEQHLAKLGTTVDEIVRNEHQRQGASNITVRNIITSMRLISDVDWSELFERISLVDDMLRNGSNFASMDFPTRNLYRSAIEELAQGAKLTELEITQAALLAASQSKRQIRQNKGSVDGRECDPSYYLIGGGRPAFEEKIRFRAPFIHWPSRFISRIGISGYIGSVVIVTVILLFLPLLVLSRAGVGGLRLVFITLLGLFPSFDVAIALVNFAITRGFSATILPGLELREGIPPNLRTMVVVPTLLTSLKELEEQIERLEIHHLASSEGELYFAFLSDWMDAKTENVDGDDSLLNAAIKGITLLNNRYGPANNGDDRFLLFHRRRVWNEGQKQWIGWERKRGKLHELNRLLRGATDTTFIEVDGRSPTPPDGVRFVITLDCDTRLPLEAARRLIGKMTHPLNQPNFDPVTGRVIEGYAILQPRVTPSLPIIREGSLFQRVFSGSNGIDPYAAAVSDVYQDLFGEGSYAGKGIYDVDAFESALEHRVPESTLLSHDLFEGIFARAGLVSDIEVVEEFPSRYDVSSTRQHRWARGDWQLLPWLLGRDYNSIDKQSARIIPLIGRWKMLDNLRRTLSTPAMIFSLLIGWTLPLEMAFVWTGFILSTLALPNFLPVFAVIIPRHARVTTGSHLRALREDLRIASLQTLLSITFLPHQAWLMTDAIGRTLFRLFVSHRNLLEWVTAAQTKIGPQLSLIGFFCQMGGGIIITLMGAIMALRVGTENWFLAFPLMIFWIASPVIARWTSLSPVLQGKPFISPAEAVNLRLIARRTWRFFETFVTKGDNLLPPDNYQEIPKPTLAHRTSPTNMGLYLLSAVSAKDFGWAGTTEIVERLEGTLATMTSLQRFRGHFYNWYDTQDLHPLGPQYISSVDSGNLAGHLIALANTSREWRGSPIDTTNVFQGIEDNLNLTRESLAKLPKNRRTQIFNGHEFVNSLDKMAVLLQQDHNLPVEEITDQLVKLLRLATTMTDIARTLVSERNDDADTEMLFWAEVTLKSIKSHHRDITRTATDTQALELRLSAIESTARGIVEAMEFGFLFDVDRKLLSIGYLVNEGCLDRSCYDLLASEARLASFIAIAKGDIPAQHWFRLGRLVTPIQRGAALISWSGSMFEYLMPSLVMRSPVGSLLEQTNRLIVHRQMTYGATLGIPWGISESAYNARDREFTYQYSNFGVPGLGLKRGLSENTVIAPYATGLATMFDPAAAVQNFSRLASINALGRYGFYEALDFTCIRLPEGKDVAIVYAYMAHHQGMTIVAIANTLLDGLMRSRFHAEPVVQAAELLLQEKTPRDVAMAYPRAKEIATVQDLTPPLVRRIHSVHSATPEAHLLSNGSYSVMLTGAGSGYSRWNNLAITRWREDVTRDDWGAYFFLRDFQSGDIWTAGYQPSGVEPSKYDVTFTENRAEFIRQDGTITTTMEVLVSPEDNAEVRRISILNKGNRTREIEITSYSEIVLAPSSADIAHPAFLKLFVQTSYLRKIGSILATRRRRSPSDPEIWAAHLSVVEGQAVGEPEIETDRSRFLGRGFDIQSPISVMDGRPLSNTVGSVLDPVFALRRRVTIPPGGTARVAYWTIIASSRNDLLDLIDKHQDSNAFERAATLAWTQAQVQLRHLGINPDEASLFQRLGSHMLYVDPLMRSTSDTICRGAGGPAALWSQSISGEHPIVLVRIDDIENTPFIKQMLHAHEYLRMKQLDVDLVILNERASSYVQDLQIALEVLVRASHPIGENNERRSVFVLRSDLISEETRAMLFSVARVLLDARRGTLSEQLNRLRSPNPVVMPHPKRTQPITLVKNILDPPDLEFFNGLGGFSEDGQEYVTILGPGQFTPAPWINVIANPSFGFQVAVEGSGYTWSLNSRENQLTPWSNDPVTDRPGEILYIRDEDTGKVWGPTALPIRNESETYIARHGQGYSQFEHTAHGIELELLQYVPLDDPLKISRLMIRNTSGQSRRLSVTAYVEWVLGPTRSGSAPFVITEIDMETGAMFARNPWNTAFGSRIAFMDLAGQQTAWTADRREFLGRNGTLDRPVGLVEKAQLSKRVGAGLDPCGVLQTSIALKPNESVEIVLFLGETETRADAQSLIARYRAADLSAIFSDVGQHWDDSLGTIQVKTPDRSMDIMLNRWILYQTIVCRMWARSAFYQASGAYGFRDQLQDGMALVLARPEITREHLLRAAARQFVEGDVQHWWLPPNGQGVRTRISDDRIWLAYATAHYIERTGDKAILDERISFLEGQKLQPGEHDAFFQPNVTAETKSLFDHCALGLNQSLGIGSHGLPFIGTGDWNDGMNRVGELGKGESIWLGWFLHKTLSTFSSLAIARRRHKLASKWLTYTDALKTALEKEGWDGKWYRRGYFDDGTTFGSFTSDECRIDSIVQSWSVISGAGDPDHAKQAMAALEEQLINENNRLALLFTPPFDQTILDPGYIKGYPPGIRENGGQYTHAATWSIIAFAMLGQGNKAVNLFSLLNPINHTNTRASSHRYKVEPYVIAADVYSVSPHVGRGGWTWYTGAAGWMYQAGIEAILGFHLQGSSLLLTPCIPEHWPGFEITFKYHSAIYDITVENPQGVSSGVAYAELDGLPLPENIAKIPLYNDNTTHKVRVLLG